MTNGEIYSVNPRRQHDLLSYSFYTLIPAVFKNKYDALIKLGKLFYRGT